MRVAVVSQKGGAGRTTTALLLAAWLATQDSTILVDLDLHPTAHASVRRSGLFSFPVATLGNNLAESLRKLADGYSHLVVDTPSHDDVRPQSALPIVDVALVPTRPDPIDLWSLRSTGAMVRAARRGCPLNASVLLTMVRDPATARSARKAIEQDDLVGLPVLEPMLSWRADYEALSRAPQAVDQHSLLVEIEAVGQTLLNDFRNEVR
jgi:chromosome partitioning protein